MPRLTLTIFEPIEVIIGAKTYTIEAISSDMMSRFMKAAQDVGTDPETLKVAELGNILAEVLPGMSKEEAAKVDIRHIIKISEFLTEQIQDAGEPSKEKN